MPLQVVILIKLYKIKFLIHSENVLNSSLDTFPSPFSSIKSKFRFQATNTSTNLIQQLQIVWQNTMNKLDLCILWKNSELFQVNLVISPRVLPDGHPNRTKKTCAEQSFSVLNPIN